MKKLRDFTLDGQRMTFKDANGVRINPSDISLVGQKFKISYAKGFFRAMNEVFEEKLTIVGSWQSLDLL